LSIEKRFREGPPIDVEGVLFPNDKLKRLVLHLFYKAFLCFAL